MKKHPTSKHAPVYLEADSQTNPLFFLSMFCVIVAVPFFIWNDIGIRGIRGLRFIVDSYFTMSFFIVWALLLILSCWQLYLQKRLGKTVLSMTQALYPGCQDVPVTLHFMRDLGKNISSTTSIFPAKLEVSCAHVDDAREDEKNTVLWWRELSERSLTQGTSSIQFALSFPSGLPGSMTLEKNIKVVWSLRVKVLGVVNTFTLPVYAQALNKPGSSDLLARRVGLHYATAESAARTAASTETWFAKYGIYLLLATIVFLAFYFLSGHQ